MYTGRESRIQALCKTLCDNGFRGNGFDVLGVRLEGLTLSAFHLLGRGIQAIPSTVVPKRICSLPILVKLYRITRVIFPRRRHICEMLCLCWEVHLFRDTSVPMVSEIF